MLKKWLKDNGYTHESFARELDLSLAFVTNILNGKHCNISLKNLCKIQKVTKIPLWELVQYFAENIKAS